MTKNEVDLLVTGVALTEEDLKSIVTLDKAGKLTGADIRISDGSIAPFTPKFETDQDVFVRFLEESVLPVEITYTRERWSTMEDSFFEAITSLGYGHIISLEAGNRGMPSYTTISINKDGQTKYKIKIIESLQEFVSDFAAIDEEADKIDMNEALKDL